MAADKVNGNNAIVASNPTCMESVNRISRLPVIESTIQTATNLYEKVKEYNSVTNWTLSTAENTVNKAMEVGKPIVSPVMQNFENPIKKVDSVLCSGLDYVESKVPSVKLPPGEMYNNTKEYLTPAVETARFYAEPAYKTAMETVEKTKEMVEPLVQPALEKAQAIKDNIMHKVDEYLHKGHECAVGDVETCEECKNVREQLEKKKEQSMNPEEEQQ